MGLTARDRKAFSIDPIAIVQCELSVRALPISRRKSADEKFEFSRCYFEFSHKRHCRAIAHDT